MGKGIIYTFILLFFFLSASAENSSSISNINTNNGLSQSAVKSIIQDGRGFIWMATNDGLNRFDGYTFKVLYVTEFDTLGFQSNSFNCVYEDANNNIWIGAEAGLYCYFPERDSIVPHRLVNTNQNANGERVAIVDILHRSNGEMWIVGEKSIFKLNELRGTFESVSFFERESEVQKESYTNIYEDFQNRLWLGSSNGMYLFNETSGKFEQQKFSDELVPAVNDIVVTVLGQVLVASDMGIYILQTDGNFTKLASNGYFNFIAISALYRDSENHIWVGTSSDGVYQFNSDLSKEINHYSVENNNLETNNILSIVEDEFGLIWLGTTDHGAYTLNFSAQKVQQISTHSNALKMVKVIAPVEHESANVWVGTSNNGICKIIKTENGFQIEDEYKWLYQLAETEITDLLEANNTLFIATTTAGIYRVDLRKKKMQQFNFVDNDKEKSMHQIDNLVLGADGNIWFSNPNHGLCYFDQQENMIHAYDQKTVDKLCVNDDIVTKTQKEIITQNLSISSMIADADQNLIIGTNVNGLLKLTFNHNNRCALTYIENKVLSNIFINCLYQVDDKIIVGSQGRGLFLLESNTLIRLGKKNGLANEVVHAIIADREGDVWVSTNRGLSMFDFSKNTFTNYSSTSYLQGHEFNNEAACRNGEGMLFFAGNNGVNFVDPSLETTSRTPRIQIVELQINNESIKVGQEYNGRIVLNQAMFETGRLDIYSDDNVIGLNLAPIHYADPKQNKFAFKLEPYETSWVNRDALNSHITYNNLGGGNYIFRYKAQNSEGEWSEEEALHIVVHPPLWEQFWFKMMIYLLGFGLVGLLFGIWYYNQKSKQEEVEQERNMMQSLIDNIPDAIYFKDLQSNFTRVNKPQAMLLGYTNADDVVGKSDFDFFDNAEETYKAEQEIIRTGTPIINQTHKQEIKGETRYFSETKIALYDIDRKCIGTVGVSRDLTDVIEAREASLENQAKFKALFDNAPLAIFRIDRNFQIVEYNYRFCDMFGYDKDASLHQLPTSELLVDAEISQLIFETVLETHEVNSEIMFRRQNGETFIGNLTLSLLDEGFKETSIEGIIEDITHMAKARDEIIKAKDKAVEADNLKSLFLANMSHEIRTPMNAIIGFTNMLKEDYLTSEDRNSFIDVIQSNGNNLMSLIDSIVDFSKLETDQMSVSFGEFNFVAFYDSICDHAEKLLLSEEKHKVKLIKSGTEVFRITTDRLRLNQVVNHLISNAVKFTDEGEIEIGYATSNNHLNFFVRDTGIGIKKENHQVVFERFAKVNDDKNRLYGGTGIGLTISKGLIELMGGEIGIESEPQMGSLFTVKLPLVATSKKKIDIIQ